MENYLDFYLSVYGDEDKAQALLDEVKAFLGDKLQQSQDGSYFVEIAETEGINND